MLTGYNTDIKHEGVIYHVQTEDGGTDNPVIVSLIYQGGRILASRKTSYAHLLGTDDLLAKIRELLEKQHKTMIKAILTNSPLAGQGKSPAAQPVQSAVQVPGPNPQAPATQAPAPAPQAAPQPQQPRPVQVPAAGQVKPPQDPKPPLEMPQEKGAEAASDLAAEKNLDQVILEYLASEIDKD